ncbi:hypothetical protein I350_07988 [Cryptococcus amylolentus CBS 6273]|uniref:C2H2-type domain-containing protein n=1 Tax=Cryptococcus amylolentus CBS 6273 TaxID=1296118 RepID=A0A1E3J808_9TREE|nr:hypothetical protein I350_07988 [Cryptococcus amylolentus CBS 6273]
MAALPPPAGDSALVPEPSPVALPPPPAPTTSTGGSGRGRNKDGKEKESFACTFPGCGQSYSRMEYLKRHQRKHQDDRPFQCKDCSKAFARSDVLLRHRRRCHPTPPPVDRDTSPPPSNRIYNNMPVSSSRTDAREQSPPRARGRKHARQSDAVDDQHDRSRPRIDPALQHEHEPEYAAEHGANGEHDGRYDEERGYDGNVYGQYYGQTNQDDHPNYSSHLMPMFAQNQAYHSLNDPNHLEDASVLLSMAYPSGVPGGEGQQEQEQRDLPDWASNPTINLIMETAVASANGEQDALPKATNGDGQEAADASAEKENGTTQAEPTAAQVISNLAEAAAAAPQPISSGAPNGDTAAESTEGGIVSEVIDPTLQDGTPGSEGFLNAMSWLSGLDNQGVLNSNKSSTLGTRGQEVATLKTGFMPEETSFPMTSLFSPSALNASLGGSSNDGSSEQASTPHILHILEQLAKYEVPQTIANPNPERPLLRLDHAAMALQAGEAFDKDSRFYLPAERFAGCYQIPHWALPPLKTLSVMACRTFHTVLNHFSFVHLPTFKLVDTAACLAFAICTVGGIKTGNASISDRFLWPAPEGNGRPSSAGAAALDGPVVPDQSWESLYEDNWYRCAEPRAAEVRNVANWANGPVVRSEKTNMLVKSFSLAKGVLMTEYNVALLQALILYHAPNFLSENDRERVPANMFLGTIVNITRQIGFFTTENDHFTPSISLPSEPFTPHELDRAWHDWIQLETRRRTAFLVYQLDTISSLESNIPCILSGCEVAYLPLPAPDTLWKAPNAQSWLKGVKKYKPMTLDEAMRRTFYLPTYGAFDALHEKADTQFYNLLNQSDYGPFARMAMVITLLRGIIDIGEGKRDRGDWRDLTDLWVGCSWLRPGKQIIAQDGTDLGIITRESLKERFRLGLQKWREGWDFDSLCSSPTRAATGHYTRSGAPGAGSAGAGVSPESDSASPREDEQSIPKETLNYCEDALPLYWLASGLLGAIISNTTHQPGQNMFSGFNYGDMLKSARTFTRTGEGVPVKLRNMSASQARNERHPSAGPPRNPNMPTPTSAPSSASASSGPPSNPPASSLDPSTHSSSHSTIPTSVSPPDQAGNDNIINQELSSLAEGMSDGTFAGIMQALAAGSGDLSMQLGLINEQGEGEGEGVREGAGAGAEGGNEGNGGGEESLQGLSDQDIAKQLGFMI